MLLEMS